MPPALQPSQIIKIGEPNLHLYVVQSMLKAISEVYPNVPTLDVTGIHDEDSVASIQWLQEISGLPVTGEIDRKTWQILARLYRIVVRDGTPETIARSLQGQPPQEEPPLQEQAQESAPDAPPPLLRSLRRPSRMALSKRRQAPLGESPKGA